MITNHTQITSINLSFGDITNLQLKRVEHPKLLFCDELYEVLTNKFCACATKITNHKFWEENKAIVAHFNSFVLIIDFFCGHIRIYTDDDRKTRFYLVKEA
jgi:hypothetical protein